MTDISVVLGKGKEYDILGNKITLKPLTVKNLDIMLNLQDDTKRIESLKSIMNIYIKQVFPEATDEEIDNVSIDFANKLMESALDVNGLTPKADE